MVSRESMHRVGIAAPTTIRPPAWVHVAQDGAPDEFVVGAGYSSAGVDHALAMLAAGIRSAQNDASSMMNGVCLPVA